MQGKRREKRKKEEKDLTEVTDAEEKEQFFYKFLVASKQINPFFISGAL